ncbi:MAG TPA: undecaprenyldiphospho-muramoylpentapeptide beta-N-acetylglucosaminyltransferase [Burkholderiales bacterium]|nr:undecaprenyldiphospho-muramoylpentapeptide beta-N-acetylglucosaminyltransferase [Burkholderiales bacterium]
MKRTIMIMAGGTGGHIFPALAVADYLRAQDWRVVWLGTKAGMESTLAAPRGYTMAWISVTGVRGKGLLRLALLPLQLLIAFWQSARAIFAHRPDVVLGMGGYVSFPGGMMASLFNRPLAIHEQNSIAGLANRVLARVADRVLTGFPDAFSASTAVVWSGNPVRTEIAALAAPEERYRSRSGPLRLTVIGGSLGAQALNAAVPQALALLPENARPRVTHQSGARHLAEVEANYQRAGVSATLVPFIADMAAQYAESDLIISRAGAATIAELAAAGIASVLVPFPHAADDHQTSNARFLAACGAAVMVPQPDFTPPRLAQLLRSFTREALLGMAQKARGLSKPDATRTVAVECMKLAAA